MSPGKLVDEKDGVGCQDKSGPGKIHEVILVLYRGGLSGKSLIWRVLKNQVLYSRGFQMYLKLTNGERKLQIDST